MTAAMFAGYRLDQLLGEGGMARVYKAYDPRFDRFVALKILRESERADPVVVARFLDEARKAGPLTHPNIVHVHRVEEEPQPFIDMELVEGPTLAAWLQQQDGRVPWPEVARIGRDLASALQHAHQRGRVHRDIKPGNILMAENGRMPKLVDFGIAVIDRPEATRLTRHGEMIGTPRYMSPEQVKSERIDARTDLYALGAVLYEMLAGAPAVEGDSLVTVTTRIVNEPPSPLRLRAPEAPPALTAVVERLMAKDPADRYASAAEAAAALEACMRQQNEPTTDPGHGARRRQAEARPRRRGALGLPAMLAGSAALVVLGVALWFLLRPPPELPTVATLPPPTDEPEITAPVTPPAPVAPPTPGAPQPPVMRAVEHAMSATEQAVIALGQVASDPEGGPLTFSAPAGPSDGPGEVQVAGDLLTFRPGVGFADLSAGATRTVTVPVTVTDAQGLVAMGEVRITVLGVGRPAPAAPGPEAQVEPAEPTPPSLPATPAAQPDIAALPPVETPLPPLGMREVIAQLYDEVRQQACARLETEATPGGLRVLVAATDPGLARGIAARLQQAADAPAPETRIASLTAAAAPCRVFDTINRSTVPVSPRFLRLEPPENGACDGADRASCYSRLLEGALAEGERLVVALEPPPGTRHLVVDYFMTDGNVAHLYPPRRADGEVVPAAAYTAPLPGMRVVIGDDRAGSADPHEYPVQAPFGDELILAVASADPLFTAARPFVEPAAGYLMALERALESSAAGTRAQASSLWLTTVAHH
jgi:hypothetical protein